MKSFNKFLGITAIVLVILLFSTFVAASVYLSTNKEILNEFSSYLGFNGHQFNFNSSIGRHKKSSLFKTLEATQKDQFENPKSIVLDVSVEHLTFIEEGRSDILVEYYHEYPDSPLYSFDYKANLDNDTLYISSFYNTVDIFFDRDYESYINIYMPKGYTLNTLDLTYDLGEVTNDSIYESVNDLNIHANLGDVNLSIDSPKNNLSITCDMGNINLTTNAPIKKLNAEADFGKIDLTLLDTVESLYADLDLGNLELYAEKEIMNVFTQANMGSINADFKEHVKFLVAGADVGSIKMTFYNNPSTTVYTTSDMGNIKVSPDLKVVKEEDNPDFKVSTNMGKLELLTK